MLYIFHSNINPYADNQKTLAVQYENLQFLLKYRLKEIFSIFFISAIVNNKFLTKYKSNISGRCRNSRLLEEM